MYEIHHRRKREALKQVRSILNQFTITTKYDYSIMNRFLTHLQSDYTLIHLLLQRSILPINFNCNFNLKIVQL